MGSWKVKEANFTGPNSEILKKMAMTSTLELKKDKTFSEGQTTGTWTLSGSTVSMTATTISGKTIAEIKDLVNKNPMLKAQAKDLDKLGQPTTGTLSEDGKTLSVSSTMGSGSIVFEKTATNAS